MKPYDWEEDDADMFPELRGDKLLKGLIYFPDDSATILATVDRVRHWQTIPKPEWDEICRNL